MSALPNQKTKAKRQRRPIYFRVEKLMRPETGELVGALVPRFRCDQREMRDRKYSTGSEVRAELKKPRNPKFHRLGHALGELAVEHIEGFAGTSAHDAVKRLQRECGVCCETMVLDLGTLGHVPVSVPRSISFDEMDEADFNALVHAICRHISTHYYQGTPPEEIEELIRKVEEGQ
jgi:hypothetical protein